MRAVALALVVAACAGARVAHAATLDLDAPIGARITIDGRVWGVLPLSSPINLEPGVHVVRLNMQGAHVTVAELQVDPQDEIVHLTMRMAPKSRANATVRSVLLAGLGQHYLERPKLGWALMAVEVGAVALAGAAQVQFRQFEDDFNEARTQYTNGLDPAVIATARADAEKAYDDMGSAESLRNGSLAVAGVAVLASALDAWFRFPQLQMGAGTTTGSTTTLGMAGDPSDRGPAMATAAADGPAVHLALQARF